jgi:hypothetical protein
MDAIDGNPVLANLKSIFAAARENDDDSVAQDESVAWVAVKGIGPHAPLSKVSEWDEDKT